jgi:mannose-6-phosphate isomerase-like protein (cupin superfamily)
MITNINEIKNRVSFIRSLPKDDVKYHDILGSSESVSMRSGLVCLHSGENVGSHNTGNREELLVILDGTAEVEIEGLGRQNIPSDSVAYIPPRTQHNVFNVDIGPLRYLYIVAPVD